jgi:hypothetical protein
MRKADELSITTGPALPIFSDQARLQRCLDVEMALAQVQADLGIIPAEAAAESATPALLVAGAIGRTEQAVREAQLARGLGYHAVLLSLAAFKGASEDEMIAHCEAVAREMPVFGFYLQPAVGGVPLGAYRPAQWPMLMPG